MGRVTKWLPLLALLLAGCTTNQLSQQTLNPVAAMPYSNLQVQVQFDNPAHTTYLANQLVTRLAKHGITATILPPDAKPVTVRGDSQAVLRLRLTGAWTDTVITTRQMPRRSLTQMRGRIPRESPRFSSQAVLVDRQTGDTVWQLETLTAGAWYSDFTTNADSLVARLVQQLAAQGLIAPRG
jgi:threonine aldolase